MVTLDIGCGSYPRDDVGLDINPNWQGRYHIPHFFDKYTAPRNPHADIVVADANFTLPFRDAAFEVVYMVHVIEHLHRPLDCLKEVRRILKKGGRLILVTPNARVSNADWLDSGHIISFTEASLKNLVRLVFKHVKVRVISEQPINSMDLMCIAA